MRHVRRGLSCTCVWGRVLWTTEHLQSWVTLNAEALAKVCFFRAVDLSQLDVLLLQCGGGFLILRS